MLNFNIKLNKILESYYNLCDLNDKAMSYRDKLNYHLDNRNNSDDKIYTKDDHELIIKTIIPIYNAYSNKAMIKETELEKLLLAD